MLVEAMEDLQREADYPASKQSKREEARHGAEAISAFMSAENELDLGGFDFARAPDDLEPLILSEVRVNVTLDFMALRTVKGEEREGGVILRLTQPEVTNAGIQKRERVGMYVATLAYLQTVNANPLGRKPYDKLCMAIDVQQGIKSIAKSRDRRIRELEAACTMIAAIWPSL